MCVIFICNHQTNDRDNIYLTKIGPRSTLDSLAATAAVLASNVTAAVRMNFIVSFVG